MLVHLKRLLSLLRFKFAHLHTQRKSSNISSWASPGLSKLAIKMSSAIPNTFDMVLNNSSPFLWNIFLVGTAPNGVTVSPKPTKKPVKSMTVHLAWDCDSLSFHELVWGILLPLAFVGYHSVQGLYMSQCAPGTTIYLFVTRRQSEHSLWCSTQSNYLPQETRCMCRLSHQKWTWCHHWSIVWWHTIWCRAFGWWHLHNVYASGLEEI